MKLRHLADSHSELPFVSFFVLTDSIVDALQRISLALIHARNLF
jgi:hypothetical protein